MTHPVAAEHNGIYRIDFDDPTIDWRLADGDVEIAPGVTAVRTAGHTPGHQSFVVRYDASVGRGGFVFAFDAADLQENIDHELPIGGVVDCDPEETVERIRRLKAIAATEGLTLVPGHDPVVWPRLTDELASHSGLFYISELVRLFVNGEEMSGGSVHHAIANAKFLGDVTTAPRYRFFSVRDEFPGLFWLKENGVPVPGELYEIAYATVRDRLLPEEPAELEPSIIERADGAGALACTFADGAGSTRGDGH